MTQPLDITQIVQAVLGALTVIASTLILPWLKSKLTEQQYKTLWDIAQIAIDAAEQIFGADGSGAEKKAYALNYMAKFGVKEEDATPLIESRVRQLKKDTLVPVQLQPVLVQGTIEEAIGVNELKTEK